MEFSDKQKAIFSWIAQANPHQNLLVQARAGSGKTTTSCAALKYVSGNNAIFLAFNKHIADTLVSRLPQSATAKTYHALGFQNVRNAYGNVKTDFDKVDRLCERVLDKYTQRKLFYPLKRLVSLCKGNLLQGSPQEVYDLMDYFDIDLQPHDKPIVCNAVKPLLELCARETSTIDFDDMIWLPMVNNLSCKTYDFIIVDEAQDTNAAQAQLVIKSSNGHSNVMVVGDFFQAIYAFRGADADALDNLKNVLRADELPLDITYRNPASVVQLVNNKFPEISFFGRDNAPEGIVETITSAKALEMFFEDDMILCRTNAPLVEYVYSLIRQGKKAVILGKDIGKGLSTLIKKFNEPNMLTFLRKLSDYYQEESDRLIQENKLGVLAALQDKIETIHALADGVSSIPDLLQKIDTIFSENQKGITFSSIHKAKGLEANRVFILHPELLPHPMAKQSWQQIQERNLEYVAYTRTLNELYIVE